MCGAGVLSACRTSHGSFIPTCFVLSARSDPFKSFVLLLRLCGGMPVAELAAFWCCPLRLLDDLHALLCRSCESAECEVAAGAGLWECSRVTKSVATKKFVREAVNHSGKRRTTIQKV